MESFERSWPGGFHDSIPIIVTTMALSRKHIKVGDAKVFDRETIYARAMGLLDGCAVLWVVPWPTSGTVHDYIVRFRSYLHGHLAKNDVYLMFDRYIEGSTTEATRSGWDKGTSQVYTLRYTARQPP